MSNKKCYDAKHDDLHGPFFPTSLTAAHAIYALTHYFTTGWALVAFGRKMPSFKRDNLLVTTADGYPWSWTLSFQLRKNSTVILCFPYWNDYQKLQDGTRTDRHIAMYVKGDVLSHDVREEFAATLVEHMQLFAVESEARDVLIGVLRKLFQRSRDPEQEGPDRIRGEFRAHFLQDVKPEVHLNTKNEKVLSATLEMTIDDKKVRIEASYDEPHM